MKFLKLREDIPYSQGSYTERWNSSTSKTNQTKPGIKYSWSTLTKSSPGAGAHLETPFHGRMSLAACERSALLFLLPAPPGPLSHWDLSGMFAGRPLTHLILIHCLSSALITCCLWWKQKSGRERLPDAWLHSAPLSQLEAPLIGNCGAGHTGPARHWAPL